MLGVFSLVHSCGGYTVGHADGVFSDGVIEGTGITVSVGTGH